MREDVNSIRHSIYFPQQDVQTTFMRGSVGQVITALIWLASAALGAWASQRLAILVLVIGGMFIFPLTQLGLRLLGRPSGLPGGHPMNALAMQIAFMNKKSQLISDKILWSTNVPYC